MFDLLGSIVIVGTFVIVGRQAKDEIGKILLILICGFILLSTIANLKYM